MILKNIRDIINLKIKFVQYLSIISQKSAINTFFDMLSLNGGVNMIKNAKKIASTILALIMVISIVPIAVFSEEASVVFTWAWDKNLVDVDNSATIVSWSGGNNASYRSAFMIFNVPDGFYYDKNKTTVEALFSINSAVLNNGEGQAPTAAVVLVNGDSVSEGYKLNNASGGVMLKEAKETGIFKGTYRITANPSQNAMTIDLSDYFEKYPEAERIGIYLTNLSDDGFECADGIASGIADVSFNLKISQSYNTVVAVDEDGNVFEDIIVKGYEGEEFKTTDVLNEAYYKDGYKYALAEDNTFYTSENPEGVVAIYERREDDGFFYVATNSGYSGEVMREGIVVATGGNAHGSEFRAPYVEGVSNASGASTLGSPRVGVMEFEISPTINPADVSEASINFYVNSVHENINGKWLRVGFYETNNQDIEVYSLGGMNEADFAQKDADYSKNSVYWSNQQISEASLGWKTVDITQILQNALDDYRTSESEEDAVRIVVRLQVPAAAVYIADENSTNAPYLHIPKAENSIVLKYDFENLTEDGRVEDISPNGYDALLIGDAALEDGKLYLSGNGAAQIDYEDFRDNLDSYTIVTTVTIDGENVNNTRIYDFGADSGNSGFLKAADFAVGMKYNSGATIYVGQNMGNVVPFAEKGNPYQLAVSYDAVNKITKAFVNGEKIIETNSIAYGLDDFANRTPNNFIGRTNWYGTEFEASNPDIKAWYEDFSVYNTALTERVIYSMYDAGFEGKVESAAKALEEDARVLFEGFITESIQLDNRYTHNNDEFDVEWYSSDTSVIDGRGNVFRGFEDSVAEIYAVVSKGGYYVETKIFTAKVSGYSDDEMNEIRVLKYTFDSDGATIEDETGKNDAVAYSVSVQADGRANIEKDNIIKLPNDINKDVVDYTIAFWLRCDDLTRDGQRVYDFGMENGIAPANYYAFTKINANGTLSVGMNNGGTTQYVTSNGRITEGEWSHIAISYNENSGETYIYINGVLDEISNAITYTMAGAVYNSHSTSNYIGRSQWYLTQSGTNPDLKGKIDNFEFYNVTLSQSAIQSLGENLYDAPEIDVSSASFVNGMNRAIVKIDSKGFEGNAVLAIASYAEHLENVGTQTIYIQKGMNSYSVELTKNNGGGQKVKCLLWESEDTLRPLTTGYIITKTYSFNYDYLHPDNHLLNNEFTLKAFDSEKYLSIANSVSMEAWSNGNRNLLWTAPYDVNNNAEGYYGLKNVNGTYLALDTGNVLTNKINNWRFIQIDPSLVNGNQNVYALLQRSSGKYLARGASGLVGVANYENESSWWVMDIVNYDTFSKMLVSPGFMRLSDNERNRIYGITSQAMWLSSNRRGTLLSYMGSNYFNLSETEQVEALRRIFSYVPTNQIGRTVNRSATGAHGTYDIGEITGSANYRGKDGENLWAYKGVATYYTDSSKTSVEQTITIYGRNANVIRNIAKGMSYIPYQFRKYIRTIKDYYHTANQFNCGANEMFVRTKHEVNAESFAQTAAHELGHSLSFSWGYVHSSGRYTSAMNSDINKVSGYGNTNSTEDMAEFTQLVVSCSGDAELLRMIKVMYPGRFGVLRAVLNEMNGGNGILNKAYY